MRMVSNAAGMVISENRRGPICEDIVSQQMSQVEPKTSSVKWQTPTLVISNNYTISVSHAALQIQVRLHTLFSISRGCLCVQLNFEA